MKQSLLWCSDNVKFSVEGILTHYSNQVPTAPGLPVSSEQDKPCLQKTITEGLHAWSSHKRYWDLARALSMSCECSMDCLIKHCTWSPVWQQLHDSCVLPLRGGYMPMTMSAWKGSWPACGEWVFSHWTRGGVGALMGKAEDFRWSVIRSDSPVLHPIFSPTIRQQYTSKTTWLLPCQTKMTEISSIRKTHRSDIYVVPCLNSD